MNEILIRFTHSVCKQFRRRLSKYGFTILWYGIMTILQPVIGQTVNPTTPTTDSLTYLLTRAPDSTFGYFIFKLGDLMIEQTSIPGLQGLKGFSRIEDAQKTANLVIEKIQTQGFPPTITVADLKKMGIPEAEGLKE